MTTAERVKHTPGPWNWTEIGTIEDCSHNPVRIATVNLSTSGTPRHANLMLIAAAPEMLEALEAVLNSRGYLDEYFPADVLDLIDKAVDKARGEK
jgi:hypothetical protein